MFELGLYREYFDNHDPTTISPGGSVLEKSCEFEEIQRNLAYLKGWLSLFEGLRGEVQSLSIGP